MSDFPEALYTAFGDQEAHPILLAEVLVRLFGAEWIEWEPETLWYEITETLRRPKWAPTVSEANRNKIQAVRTLQRSDSPWEQWEVFVPVALALSGNVPRFDVLNSPTLAQAMGCKATADQVQKKDLGEDVLYFLSAVCLEAGVCWLPEPLSAVNEVLNPVLYHCRDCGNEDTLEEDGYCDVCVCRYTDDRPLNLRPDPVRVKQGKGRNLRTFYKYNWEEVQEFYNETMRKNVWGVEFDWENSADVQVSKILGAKLYVAAREEQLNAQREALQPWITI